MQDVFNITSIVGDYANKTITIQANYIVDETTVNKKNVKVVDASSGTVAIYKLSADKDKIIITLKEWPQTNSLYQVNVTFIKDRLGREINSPLTKNIEFKSDTKLKAKVICPLNNQAVNEQHNLVYFAMYQIDSDEITSVRPKPELTEYSEPTVKDVNILSDNTNIEAILGVESDIKYHFEFASDIAFSHVIKDYISEYTDGLIQLDNGQYYVRARVIEDEMLGDWSDVITFTVIPNTDSFLDEVLKDSQKDYLDDILAPVDFFLDNDEVMEIVSRSENGETLSEFYIEFNLDIDPDSLPNQLIAYRRDF